MLLRYIQTAHYHISLRFRGLRACEFSLRNKSDIAPSERECHRLVRLNMFYGWSCHKVYFVQALLIIEASDFFFSI